MTKRQENFGRDEEVWQLSDLGLSQREIAERLGLARTSVQYILTKKARPVDGKTSVKAFVDELIPSIQELDDFRVYVEGHYGKDSKCGFDAW